MTESTTQCLECLRLHEQAGAALLCGDRSRLTDVRVLQRRHEAREHREAAKISSPPTG